MTQPTFNRQSRWLLLAALGLLLLAYVPTVQTIPNGSSHYYMIDVGETQIVLNTWGTLHATGYPLYVMTGNLLTSLLRALGVAPVVAPALVSLLWGLVALALLYTLAHHLTGRPLAAGLLPAGAITLLFGLTRTVWIHAVVAEIYSFTLALLVLLLLIGLWRGPVKGRVYWLALLGGIGVAHHRALLMVAPALIYAAWPEIWPELTARPRRRGLRLLFGALALGLLGLLPYVYLPLRANAGAAWIYGAPGTWQGLMDQFLGVEANRFMGLPESGAALAANFATVNAVLVTDLTLPGLLAGLTGLVAALWDSRLRHAAVTMLISGGVAYGFHVLLYADVLSALILAVTLALAFGWLFLIVRLVDWLAGRWRQAAAWGWLPVAVALGGVLAWQNGPFIRTLVTDPTGLETIAQATAAPPDSTLLIPWGTRHFAVGLAKDVDPALANGLAGGQSGNQLQDVTLVDHRADVAGILADGTLIAPDYAFYSLPPDWWAAQANGPVYLQAAAPHLVQISTAPEQPADPPGEFGVLASAATCTDETVILAVTWYTPDVPAQDLSVFVHAWSADETLLAQGDQTAPVYGWRPLTSWTAGEAIHDVYPVVVDPATVAVMRYGLYQATDSGFENLYTYELPLDCE